MERPGGTTVLFAHGGLIAAAALRYVLRHPAVTAAVVGVRTPDEIRADAGYLGWPIPAALWADLGLDQP